MRASLFGLLVGVSLYFGPTAPAFADHCCWRNGQCRVEYCHRHTITVGGITVVITATSNGFWCANVRYRA